MLENKLRNNPRVINNCNKFLSVIVTPIQQKKKNKKQNNFQGNVCS